MPFYAKLEIFTMLRKIAEKSEKTQQTQAKYGKERYEKNYDKSIIHLTRQHMNI